MLLTQAHSTTAYTEIRGCLLVIDACSWHD